MRRILISGSTGLLGRRLVTDLRAAGDTVIPLVRSNSPQPSREDAIPWISLADELDPALVSGFDAVIHLAGEPVASSRWTASKKRRISESRVHSTRTLVSALAAAPRPPAIFLCASGITVYGDRGSTILSDTVPHEPGSGFLAEVCRAWESACDPLRPIARVANLRIGAVLSTEGGLLRTTLPLFRLGPIGGPIAGGQAWLSWISLDDFARAVAHLLHSSTLAGAINLVSPHPVTNRGFSAVLAGALHRPALLPVPGPLVRLVFGELAEETVLSSTRAVPSAFSTTASTSSKPS